MSKSGSNTSSLPLLTGFVLLGQLCSMTAGQVPGRAQNPNQPHIENPSKDPNHNPYYNYNYYGQNQGGHDYGGYEYGQHYPNYEDYVEPPTYHYIQCYSCFYHVKNGHTQGMENCKDPFNPTDIPTVDCKGPCGKVYTQTGENSYNMIRACVPNCKEYREADSYHQCCSLSQCNAATSSHTVQIYAMLFSVLFTAFMVLQR